MLDLLLRGGLVFDGTGTAGRNVDVGVAGSRLQLHAGGHAPTARDVVDVSGLFVSPGFIDVHSHSDVALLELGTLHDKIRQGITSEIVGNCGISPYPVSAQGGEAALREIVEPVSPGPWSLTWTDTGSYFTRLQEAGIDANVGALVGHGTLRAGIVGMEDREPSSDELAAMQALLADAMDQGAMGLSLGLLYPPGCYATSGELVGLADTVARKNGVLSCHMRSYLAELIPALVEVLEVAAATGVQLEVSHLMTLDERDAQVALELLHQARDKGVNVAFDQYPYDRGMTSAQTLLPPWMLAGGTDELLQRLNSSEQQRAAVRDMYDGIPGWDNLVLAVGWDNITLVEPVNHSYCGRPLSDVALEAGSEPATCLFEFLKDTRGFGTMTMRLTNDEAIETLMRDKLGCFGTDGIPRLGNSHPRTFGTYPRLLGHYCRERGVLSWAEMIRRATSEPARRFGLKRRGVVADGYQADIVVFDPTNIADRSSYLESRSPAGIEHVIVNGKQVVAAGQPTNVKPGEILRREVQS